jgi:hypothetical protein
MNKRARVTRVTMGIRYPGGMTEMRHIDGQEAEAILNSDRGVTEILAPFYRKMQRSLKADELIASFGSGITALTGQREEVPITPQLVKELWHFKNEEGLLMPFVSKIPNCYLGFPKLCSGISFPQTANPRPQVSGVTLQLLYPDGQTKEMSFKEGSFEGLFWSERTVLEILAPFYETTERRLSRADLIDVCGPRASSLIGNRDEIQITPALVADLWNLENEEGLLPPVIMKIPDCILEIPRLQATVKSISRRKAA